MNRLSEKLRRHIRLAMLVTATPFLFLSCYGFLSGMVDAALENGGIPAHLHRAAELYCAPAGQMSYVPWIGNLVKVSNYFGYDFAGGPETTR